MTFRQIALGEVAIGAGPVDFTCTSSWQGWPYAAFVVDVFALRIVGWQVSSSMQTDSVLDALEQVDSTAEPLESH